MACQETVPIGVVRQRLARFLKKEINIRTIEFKLDVGQLAIIVKNLKNSTNDV